MSLLNPQGASVQQALGHMQRGQNFLARQICEQLLSQSSKNTAAHFLLAQIEWQDSERDEAIRRLDRLVRLAPKDLQARMTLARYLNHLGRYKEAVRHFEKVQKMQPNDVSAIEGIAAVHETGGQYDKARAILERYAGTPKETPAMGLVLAKLAIHDRNFEEAAAIARRHVASDIPKNNTEVDLLFTLGQALEKLGDYDAAFDAYTRAHQLERPQFNREEFAQSIDRLIDVFTPETLSRLPRAKNRSEKPVFIVSRPRSGNTLVERILSAHPDIHDAGDHPFFQRLATKVAFDIGSTEEYPECVRDLEQEDVDRVGQAYIDYLTKISRSAKRVTNMALTNWMFVGLIELVCPGARVVDLRREAVDNCLACYTVNLGGAILHPSNLSDLGFVRRQYERVMDHWNSVLSIPILRLNYEDLVADQEHWSRRLIEFCGLEWDDRCLKFYEHGGKGSASFTFSYAQVRQPIYKTSVGRADKFRKHLGPLFEALGVGEE